MNERDVQQVWARLGEEGKAPTELGHRAHAVPDYTVGIQPWIDRLAQRYLRGLCREDAHFKLVLAPYGGGKTHFLYSFMARALTEKYAVSYVPCSPGLSLDNPLAVYRELVKALRLPGENSPGLQTLIETVIRTKREEIGRAAAPDVEGALRRWRLRLRRDDFPENAFGRVMAAALEAVEGDGDAVGEAAFTWLQGDPDVLTRGDLQELHLAKPRASDRTAFGRNLLLSFVKFLPQAGVHGLVLLLDEVETLSQVKGKALLRILAALRVFLDSPAGVPGGAPLCGVFAATPDVLDEFSKHPALKQRLAVRGASFAEGNDLAMQLPLDQVLPPETLLEEVGRKLIRVGELATGHAFDARLQENNARLLAEVACERNLDVDARRLFVKTWVNLLELQCHDGERLLERRELADRYAGAFNKVESDEAHAEGYEP